MSTPLAVEHNFQAISPMTAVVEPTPRSLLVDPIFSTEAVLHLDEFIPVEIEEEIAQPVQGRKLQVRSGELGWHFKQSIQTNFPLLAADLLCIGICYSLGFLLGTLFSSAPASLNQYTGYLSTILMSYLFITVFLGAWKTTGISPVVELKNQIVSIFFAHVCVISLKGVLGEVSVSEMVAVSCSLGMCCVALYFVRSISRTVLARYNWWGERLVVVGAGSETNAIIRFFERSAHRGLKPVGVVDSLENFSRVNVAPGMYLGDLQDLPSVMASHRANWCIASVHGREQDEVREIMGVCTGVPNLILLNSKLMLPTLWSRFYECAGISGIHIRDQLLSPATLCVKRMIDILGSLVALLAASPILITLGIMIKVISPGPIFYSQKRLGKNREVIRVWKLRSMVPNAEAMLQEYLNKHPELQEEWDKERKLKNDPRIIPIVGKFIRGSSLDEIPQFWNVLIGDMSLVGPRPVPLYEVPDYGSTLPLYLRTLPGITGLWQISGRNNTSYEDRIRLDAYYVRNWSPWLDYFILLRTVRTILFREGAY